MTGAPALAAPPERTVEVIQLAGEEFTDDCTGPMRYVSGEMRIREQIVYDSSGGRSVQYFMHTVGAIVLSLDTGVLYRDITQDHISNQGNGTFFDSRTEDGVFEDGSHGVRNVGRIRLFAPGTDAPELVVRYDFHLRRVAGSEPTPPLDMERFSFSCE
jgi:hypothetical protein